MTDRAPLEHLDTQARARALDPHRSILLQAPAGSGKTSVLTQRFLRLLCEVDEPEQILAITFTRKAAGEMRERVFRALRNENREQSAHSRLLRELAAAARERSRELGWALESSPGRLRIQTIDSLNRWLASQLPVSARATGDLVVMESPRTLYELAARRTLLDAESDERLQGDTEQLFERLDNDFARFERLLTAMLEVRSQWLPHLLASDPSGLCERVQASLQSIIAERLASAAATIPHRLVEQGAWLAREAATRRHAQGDASAGAWRVWIEDTKDVGPARLTLRHWQGLCQLALTEQGTWRCTLTKREGFPAEEKQLKSAALRWIDTIRGVGGSHELFIELAALPQPTLPADDARTLESLARLLRLAAAELEVVFRETGRVDYPYVAAAARRALLESGAPTELGLRLGAEIRHILVDEFQDTSIEQCALLKALTAGWDDGDGRTLFVVGDPMQSIYQFREAEVGLFLRTRDCGLGSLRLEALTLTRNFRAAGELVAWTNAKFPRVFPQLDEPRASAVRYLECIAARLDAGPGIVRLHRSRPADPRDEADRIASLIVSMRAAEPAATTAVLVTARTHAAPIVAALHAAHVPVAGVDLVSLAELPVVRDLTGLARALDHLADRTAWLAVLRAPWCGLSLRELSTLLDNAPFLTVWEAIADPARIERLPQSARARLARTRTVLGRALQERDQLEPARWIETTWLRLGGPATCAGDEDLEHARAFFESLARWSSEPDWAGPLTVEERLAELYAIHAAPAADAVQIMTIHRAKGLEFDKVIVPGLGRKLRSNTEPLLRWLELPRQPDGSDLLMAAIPNASGRAPAPLSEYLKSLQMRRAAHERARLLYVAATRARSELHLFGELAESTQKSSSPAPASGTLLATLWSAIADEFPVETGAQSEAPAGIAVRAAPLTRLPADWQLPAIEPGPTPAGLSVASYEPAEAVDILPGSDDAEHCAARVVCEQLRRCARHRALPDVRQPSALERPLRERLARLGLADADLEHCARRAAQMLASCLADPRLQWIFSASHANVHGPLELTGFYSGRLTSVSIDCSFVDRDDVRWVISFHPGPCEGDARRALARELERFRPQLEKHAALARQLGPHLVRAGIYVPALQAFGEL